MIGLVLFAIEWGCAVFMAGAILLGIIATPWWFVAALVMAVVGIWARRLSVSAYHDRRTSRWLQMELER